jgi:hypothetical protein
VLPASLCLPAGLCAALPQADLLPVCRELGIGVLAYSPLGCGLLTGQLKDLSQLHPSDFRTKMSPQFEAENHKQVCRVAGWGFLGRGEGGGVGWGNEGVRCSGTTRPGLCAGLGDEEGCCSGTRAWPGCRVGGCV